MTFCPCCRNLGSIRGKPGLIPCPACRTRRARPSLLRAVRAWDLWVAGVGLLGWILLLLQAR